MIRSIRLLLVLLLVCAAIGFVSAQKDQANQVVDKQSINDISSVSQSKQPISNLAPYVKSTATPTKRKSDSQKIDISLDDESQVDANSALDTDSSADPSNTSNHSPESKLKYDDTKSAPRQTTKQSTEQPNEAVDGELESKPQITVTKRIFYDIAPLASAQPVRKPDASVPLQKKGSKSRAKAEVSDSQASEQLTDEGEQTPTKASNNKPSRASLTKTVEGVTSKDSDTDASAQQTDINDVKKAAASKRVEKESHAPELSPPSRSDNADDDEDDAAPPLPNSPRRTEVARQKQAKADREKKAAAAAVTERDQTETESTVGKRDQSQSSVDDDEAEEPEPSRSPSKSPPKSKHSESESVDAAAAKKLIDTSKEIAEQDVDAESESEPSPSQQRSSVSKKSSTKPAASKLNNTASTDEEDAKVGASKLDKGSSSDVVADAKKSDNTKVLLPRASDLTKTGALDKGAAPTTSSDDKHLPVGAITPPPAGSIRSPVEQNHTNPSTSIGEVSTPSIPAEKASSKSQTSDESKIASKSGSTNSITDPVERTVEKSAIGTDAKSIDESKQAEVARPATSDKLDDLNSSKPEAIPEAVTDAAPSDAIPEAAPADVDVNKFEAAPAEASNDPVEESPEHDHTDAELEVDVPDTHSNVEPVKSTRNTPFSLMSWLMSHFLFTVILLASCVGSLVYYVHFRASNGPSAGFMPVSSTDDDIERGNSESSMGRAESSMPSFSSLTGSKSGDGYGEIEDKTITQKQNGVSDEQHKLALLKHSDSSPQGAHALIEAVLSKLGIPSYGQATFTSNLKDNYLNQISQLNELDSADWKRLAFPLVIEEAIRQALDDRKQLMSGQTLGEVAKPKTKGLSLKAPTKPPSKAATSPAAKKQKANVVATELSSEAEGEEEGGWMSDF